MNYRFFQYLIVAALFIYVVLRSSIISFTWDEAYSFQEFILVHQDTPLQLNYNLANHHLLNSFLSKVSYFLFGMNEWALRIPNMIAFIIYAFCSLFFLKLNKKWSSVLLFVLLFFNHYVIDFFSLERGYGLAVAFVMLSLLNFQLYFNKEKFYYLWFSLLSAICAVFSSFSSAYFLLIIGFAFAILFVKQIAKFKPKDYIISLLIIPVVAFSGFYLLQHFKLLNETQSLFFGGNTGIWYDILIPLMLSFFNFNLSEDITWLHYMISFFVYGIICFSILLSVFNKSKSRIFHVKYSLILIAIIFVHFLHVYFQNTLFLKDRTWLFITPIFALAINEALLLIENKTIGKYMVSLLVVFITISFLLRINFYHTKEFYFDADAKSMMEDIKVLCKKNPTRFFTIGIDFNYEPVINYYKKKYGLSNLNFTLRSDFDNLFEDYYLIHHSSKISRKNLKTIKNYQNGGLFLKNNFRFSEKSIINVTNNFDSLPLNFNVTNTISYSGIQSTFVDNGVPFSATIDTLIPDYVLENYDTVFSADVKFKFYTQQKYCDAFLVVDVKDSSESIHYRAFPLDMLYLNINKWHEIKLNTKFCTGKKVPKKISVYMYNLGVERLHLDDLNLVLKTLKHND